MEKACSREALRPFRRGKANDGLRTAGNRRRGVTRPERGSEGELEVIEVERLLEVLRQAPGDAQVNVSANLTDFEVRAGRVAKWVGSFRTASNRRTTFLFLESLRDRYGPSISDYLSRTSGLDTDWRQGKPLRARQVRSLVHQAEALSGDFPDARPRIQIPTEPPVGPAFRLNYEIDRALSRGYVSRFEFRGESECRFPMPDEAFLRLLTTYNRTMEDLHDRFPRLADLEPPKLSQSDLAQEAPALSGTYNVTTQTLKFANLDPAEHHRRRAWALGVSSSAPKASGLVGVIVHEYAHHLASSNAANREKWKGSLAALLRRQGFVGENTAIYRADPGGREFSVEVGKNVREMGLGFYGGTSVDEFVAEALAWRMAPGYGASVEVPRMLRFLEDWVHDCFPFTRSGSIPADAVEFRPAMIKEPVRVGEEVVWVERGARPPTM